MHTQKIIDKIELHQIIGTSYQCIKLKVRDLSAVFDRKSPLSECLSSEALDSARDNGFIASSSEVGTVVYRENDLSIEVIESKDLIYRKIEKIA